MAFDWEEYSRLAQVMGKEGASEAEKRSAISRAYYATLHACRSYALTLNWQDVGKRGGLHSALPQFFKNDIRNIDHHEIGDKLRQLRDYREECDYTKEVAGLDKKLKATFIEAGEIRRLIRG